MEAIFTFFNISEVQLPNILFLFFIFILGAVVGSFLNVVVYRLGTGERIGHSRSRCFSCGKTLQWYELIPLVSFVIQRGKCRKCGSRISIQYPIVEFITGLLFSLLFSKIIDCLPVQAGGLPACAGRWITTFEIFLFLYLATIFSLLIAISIYDFRHKIIPNQFVYPFIIIAFFFPVIQNSAFIIQNIVSHTIAGFAAFSFFGGLWFVSKGRWMGFGDAKLALGIGFLLGPIQTLLALLMAFWIGTLVAVPIALLQGRNLKMQIPFGPFLVVGYFVSWMWSEWLFLLYTSFLL
jgi:leader peptidase (prepilin peptidase) / N-methyltransferase